MKTIFLADLFSSTVHLRGFYGKKDSSDTDGKKYF